MALILKKSEKFYPYIKGKLIRSDSENIENVFSSKSFFPSNLEIPSYLENSDLEEIYTTYLNNKEETIYLDLIPDSDDVRYKKAINPTFLNISKEKINEFTLSQTKEKEVYIENEKFNVSLNFVDLSRRLFYLDEVYKRKKNILDKFTSGIFSSLFSKVTFKDEGNSTSILNYELEKAAKKEKLNISAEGVFPFKENISNSNLKWFNTALKVENALENTEIFIKGRGDIKINFRKIITSLYEKEGEVFFNYIFLFPKYLIKNNNMLFSFSDDLFIENYNLSTSVYRSEKTEEFGIENIETEELFSLNVVNI